MKIILSFIMICLFVVPSVSKNIKLDADFILYFKIFVNSVKNKDINALANCTSFPLSGFEDIFWNYDDTPITDMKDVIYSNSFDLIKPSIFNNRNDFIKLGSKIWTESRFDVILDVRLDSLNNYMKFISDFNEFYLTLYQTSNQDSSKEISLSFEKDKKNTIKLTYFVHESGGEGAWYFIFNKISKRWFLTKIFLID